MHSSDDIVTYRVGLVHLGRFIMISLSIVTVEKK